MKTRSNKIKDIKDYIFEELKTKYPKTEINSLTSILFEKYSGLNSAHILAFEEDYINESELLNIVLATEQLKKERPIQQILGYTEFCGLKIKVSPDVLIPRPETEELCYKIIEQTQSVFYKKEIFSKITPNISEGKEIFSQTNSTVSHEKEAYSQKRQTVSHEKQTSCQNRLRVLDLCCGSGCIALSLKKHLPDSEVYAVDVSPSSLQIAKENSRNLDLDISFIQGDLLKDFDMDKDFDIIVSNPPYVMQKEKAQMKNNVLKYEPSIALFVEDEKPLVFYEKIRLFAQKHLSEHGRIYLEINENLSSQTLSLFPDKEYFKELVCDMFGKHRFIFLEKKQ